MKCNKPVFKGDFYYIGSSPIEHRKKKMTFFRMRNRIYTIVEKPKVIK